MATVRGSDTYRAEFLRQWFDNLSDDDVFLLMFYHYPATVQRVFLSAFGVHYIATPEKKEQRRLDAFLRHEFRTSVQVRCVTIRTLLEVTGIYMPKRELCDVAGRTLHVIKHPLSFDQLNACFPSLINNVQRPLVDKCIKPNAFSYDPEPLEKDLGPKGLLWIDDPTTFQLEWNRMDLLRMTQTYKKRAKIETLPMDVWLHQLPPQPSTAPFNIDAAILNGLMVCKYNNPLMLYRAWPELKRFRNAVEPVYHLIFLFCQW